MTIELASKIAEWQTLSTWMAVAKVKEMTLRKEIAAEVFPDLKEGTQSTTLDTMKVKATQKYNYTPTKDEKELARIHGDNPGLLKFKSEVSVAAFRALTDEQKKAIGTAIEIKPGAIELEIVKNPV